MSEINYYSIEEAIANLFKADADLLALSPTIEIEEDDNLVSDKCPYIGIYFSSWESPHTEERIGGTTPFTTYLVFDIWCYEFALENKQGAILRDTLLQKVKEILKENRKLSDTVLITRFQGGDFDNARNSEGYFKGVSIKLQAEVRE